jgi:hypothetical protein
MRPSVGMTIRRSRTPFGRWRSAQLSLTENTLVVVVLMLSWLLDTLRALTSVLVSFVLSLRDSLRSRAAVRIEMLALRHQLRVLERSRRPRVRLTRLDRFLWVWLSRQSIPRRPGRPSRSARRFRGITHRSI